MFRLRSDCCPVTIPRMSSMEISIERFSPLSVPDKRRPFSKRKRPLSKHQRERRKNTPHKTRKRAKMYKTSRRDIFIHEVDDDHDNIGDNGSSTTPVLETTPSESTSGTSGCSFPLGSSISSNTDLDDERRRVYELTCRPTPCITNTPEGRTDGGRALSLRLAELLLRASRCAAWGPVPRGLTDICQGAATFIDGIINFSTEINADNRKWHASNGFSLEERLRVTTVEVIKCLNALAEHINVQDNTFHHEPWYQDPDKFLELSGLSSVTGTLVDPDASSPQIQVASGVNDDFQHSELNIGMEVVVSNSAHGSIDHTDDDDFPIISEVYSLNQRTYIGRQDEYTSDDNIGVNLTSVSELNPLESSDGKEEGSLGHRELSHDEECSVDIGHTLDNNHVYSSTEMPSVTYLESESNSHCHDFEKGLRIAEQLEPLSPKKLAKMLVPDVCSLTCVHKPSKRVLNTQRDQTKTINALLDNLQTSIAKTEAKYDDAKRLKENVTPTPIKSDKTPRAELIALKQRECARATPAKKPSCNNLLVDSQSDELREAHIVVQVSKKCHVAVQTEPLMPVVMASGSVGYASSTSSSVTDSTDRGHDPTESVSPTEFKIKSRLKKSPRRRTKVRKMTHSAHSGCSGGSGDSNYAQDLTHQKSISSFLPDFTEHSTQTPSRIYKYHTPRAGDHQTDASNRRVHRRMPSLTRLFTPETSATDVSTTNEEFCCCSPDVSRISEERPQLFPARNTRTSQAAAAIQRDFGIDISCARSGVGESRRGSRASRVRSPDEEVIGDVHKRGFQHTNECFQVIDSVYNMVEAYSFRSEVSSIEDPQYHKVVKFPMCMDTITYRLRQRLYTSLNEVIKDCRRIFWNCRLYYPLDSEERKHSDIVEACMEAKIAHIFPNIDFSDITGSPPVRSYRKQTVQGQRKSDVSPPVLNKSGKLPGELRSLFG